MTRYIAVIIFIASIFVLCKAQYRPSGSCESSQSCAYRYSSTQRSFDGDQLQVATVSAVVVSRCDSAGVYGNQKALYYCIKVSGVRVGGDLVKDDSTDEVIDPTEDEILELDPNDSVLHDPPISPEDKMMAGEFCFVQTDDGKTVEVSYPEGDSSVAVNFKKGIVAAFQTNFKGTAEQEEEDTTSLHKSAYTYATIGTETTAFRTIQTSDIHILAGGTPTEDFQITANEQIVYIGKVLSRSHGSTSIVLTAGFGDIDSSRIETATPQLNSTGPGDEEDMQTRVIRQATGQPVEPVEPATYDSDTDIKELKGEGEYTLVKMYCRPVTKRDTMEEDGLKKLVTDTLQANINYTLTDLRLLEALRHQIPSVWEALETLHSDAGQSSLANRLHQLVALEGEYQPLPALQPAIRDVINFLEKLLGSDKIEDKKMRSLIYSLLATEGHLDSQMVLLNSYFTSVDKEEKNGVITHIAFTRNPHPEFIERLKKSIDSSPTSVDPLLLAYGALASDKEDGIQTLVVKDLIDRLERLEAAVESSKKLHPLIHNIHALGNTDSELMIETVLKYLNSTDIDVQLASINALKAHSVDERVQEQLQDFILSAQFQDQIEAIVQMLIEALDKVTDKESHNTYVDALASIDFFEDSKLHSLVTHYLQKLGTKHALDYNNVLQSVERPDNEDETFDVRDETDARVRRGSDWDASSSIYDLVASYSSRRSDVNNHPSHKAYIWGKKFGISKLYAQMAAGGFAGIKRNGGGYKLFGKVIAQGHAFGRTYTALRAELLRERTGNSIYQRIYAKVVGKTLINEAGTLPSGCNTYTKNLYSASVRIFRFSYSVFIYVGTLDFYVGMTAQLGLSVKAAVCETTVRACASLIPSVTLRADGGASATILLAVRGGVEVVASFTYMLEPETCIHYCRFATQNVKTCVNVYNGWPNNYAEIYAYYQTRGFRVWPPRFYWRSKRRWSALSKRWDLSSFSRRRIWSSCDRTPVCG